jgi:catechol 2,3-dioxygenase-like lactoylglutathione lyase family enzyme
MGRLVPDGDGLTMADVCGCPGLAELGKMSRMSSGGYAVEHIGLAARDPVSLAAWYGALPGARVRYRSPEEPPAFLVELPGGVMVEVYAALSPAAAPGDNRQGGWRHLALRVASIDRARDVFAAAGVAFDEPVRPAGGGGRVQFFKDPEGNLLHLVERPDAWAPTGGG